MRRTRTGPIKVVIVDDSPTVREFLVAIFQDAGLEVVGTGANGVEAVRLVKRLRPDVLTLDVNMPLMDGLQATRQIMCEVPTPIVIVAGSLIQSDADITFEALRSGALTVVRTPGLADPEGCRKVIQAVRLMAEVPVVHHWGREQMVPAVAGPEAPGPLATAGADVALIGIAASTGGPSALAVVLGGLPADFPVPILVVQHIARGFLGGLVNWLAGETTLQVGIANHGDVPQAGSVLFAPDDYHLQVNHRGVIELTRELPFKSLRPSANHLFRSLAVAYGERAVGIVLSGMGDDGAQGLDALHRAGGLTLAQDEASCVVYGMPKEALAQSAVDRVLTPPQIVATLLELAATKPQPQEQIYD